MPLAYVRGVAINYVILGEHGPWVAISPGGRHGLEGVQSLAARLAAAGYRVLIHDRRNCGASDVAIEGNESEYEIWADDLYELHHLKIKDYDLELSPRDEWNEKESELAAIFTGFLKRVKSPVAA